MARKKGRRGRKGSSGFFGTSRSFSDMAKGAAIAAIVEPIADQFIASFAPSIPRIANVQPDDLIKVGIGLFVGKQKGVVGQTARFLGLFGVRNIVKQFVGGQITQFTAGATAPPATRPPVASGRPGAAFR